jgi:hypothetical protein
VLVVAWLAPDAGVDALVAGPMGLDAGPSAFVATPPAKMPAAAASKTINKPAACWCFTGERRFQCALGWLPLVFEECWAIILCQKVPELRKIAHNFEW